MTQKKTWWMGAAALLLLGLALAWAFAPRPVEVEVASVTKGRFETTVDEDGKTRLAERFVVSAPLAGRLTRITLREGDAVQAGLPVAMLTPVLSPMLDERTVREQGARVATAQAQVRLASARVASAQVALEQARNEQRRTEQLAPQGFVSPTKLETDRLAVQAAQRELDAAAEARHVADHGLDEARAALLAVRQPGAGAAAGFAVRSPVAGQVLRVAQPSEASVPLGAPLVEVGDIAKLEIVVELLTTDALQARAGSRVRIERWGGLTTLEGRVRRVEPAAFTKVSALGVEEQRVNVLIDLTSPREQWSALGDGFRVSVHIVTLSVEDAVRVPVSAVFPLPAGSEAAAGPRGMAVFVVDGGRARTVPVEVGARNGTHAWVRHGIEPGTSVIAYPPATVRDGVRVKSRQV
jgi:HlyD family secretion protein